MNTLTLSPKFQLVIPKHIREAMKLKAGMSMQVVQYPCFVQNMVGLMPPMATLAAG